MDSATKRVEVFTPAGTEEDLRSLCHVEKLAWSSPGENIEADASKILARLTSFKDGVSLATVDNNPAGSQYSFTFDWKGDLDSLTTWDKSTSSGWTNLVHRPNGNTGFLVGVGVVPDFRRKTFQNNIVATERRISELLIIYTLQKLFTAGVSQVLACARIPLYHSMPQLSVGEYCMHRRGNGDLYDPVLRFHQHLGASVIKPVAYAMDDAESLNAGCFVLYNSP